jgi:transcriptional regulator with XRE-family HTH domain
MNPLKEFREHEQITQSDLANEAGVTRQIITNLEKGLLSQLPSRLSAITHIPQQDYLDWVSSQRLKNQHYFRTPEVRALLSNHPLLSWRLDKNRWLSFKWTVQPNRSHRGFCRRLVYQPSLLTLYETKNQCKPSLIQALKEVGLSLREIEATGIVLT